MKIISLLTAALLSVLVCKAQINMDDSTISVIGYWDKNETQSYSFLQEKYKVKDSDTTSKETIRFDVDVLIKDSTSKSYTIVWTYKNVNTQTENELTNKFINLFNNMSVIFKTDEMGSFQEVVNWKEIRTQINDALELLRKEYKDISKIEEITRQISSKFNTKEAIESLAIKEILQTYTFHGGKYKLNEVLTGKEKMANLYGGEPFDSNFEIEFSTIDTSNSSGVISYTLDVDKKQLTDATFEYLNQIARTTGTPEIKREEFPELSVYDRTVSNIHGPTGWVLYSLYIREVVSEDGTNVERREIELK